jgi:hypothetical protein
MKRLALAMVVAAIPAAAIAQSMNADAFYKRARTLEKKGPLAIFSKGEIKALSNEVGGASNRANAERKAALAGGGKPRFCPPNGSRMKLNSKDFLQFLGAIPPAERARINMTEVMTRVFADKLPCRAA